MVERTWNCSDPVYFSDPLQLTNCKGSGVFWIFDHLSNVASFSLYSEFTAFIRTSNRDSRCFRRTIENSRGANETDDAVFLVALLFLCFFWACTDSSLCRRDCSCSSF